MKINEINKSWDFIIGLEIHVQIENKSKIFSECSYGYAETPNSLTCPTSIGLPGALPNINQSGKYKNDSLSPVAPFRILNIGNTKKVYLLDFIKQIEKELGKKAIRNYMPLQQGDVKQTLSNTNLLKKLTGYNPKTNYKLGIKKFLKWYLNYYN